MQSQFWDMNSLQAALPNVPTPTSFTSDTDQIWFHQDPMGPYGSEGKGNFLPVKKSNINNSWLCHFDFDPVLSGALGFMTTQASNAHIP